MLTATYAILFYAATAILIGGLAARIALYTETPAPLRIPTTPAPKTKSGVALRVASEVLVFFSLFRSNKWIWLLGWAMHVALLLVILRHLRYFLEPLPQLVVWLQPLGIYAAYVFIAALLGLWLRRFIIDRMRHISSLSDHLMLALLLGIAVTGMSIKHLQPTDIVAVKGFFIGLLRFDWQELPADPLLLIHLSMVALLMIIFPFSKLLHAPGVFFSPTRNQPIDARERRYLSGWTANLGGYGEGPSHGSYRPAGSAVGGPPGTGSATQQGGTGTGGAPQGGGATATGNASAQAQQGQGRQS